MLKDFKAEIMLIFVSFIWGAGFIVTKSAIDEGLGAVYIMSLRLFISAFFVMLLCIYKKVKITRKAIEGGIVTGFFLSTAFIAQTWGLVYTTPIKNSLFTGLSVIFVPYIMSVIFKKKIDKYIIIASILAFIGMAELSGLENFNLTELNIGDILTIICAFLFALHIISTGRYVNEVEPLPLALTQFIVAWLITMVIALFLKEVKPISTKAFYNIIYLGVFSGFLGFTIQIFAQKVLSPSRTVIIFSLEFVFATIFSILLGYDKLSLSIIIGFISIFSSIIIAETKLEFLKIKRR